MLQARQMSLRSRVVSGVFWLGATKALGQVISWGTTIYVARLLSPDDYGLMGMAGAFLGFIVVMNELGLGSAIVQKKELSEEELSNIGSVVILINAALYGVSFLSAPWIARFFGEPRLTEVIRTLSLVLIFSGMGATSFHMLTRKIIFKKRSQAELIGNVSGAVSTLLFAVNGLGVWSLVYGNIVLELTKNLFFYIFSPWKPKLRLSLSKVKGVIHFGLKVAVARLLWYFYSNADFWIAGKLLGKTLLGYYAMAFQFASVPNDKIVSFVTQVSLPALSQVQGDLKLLKRYFLKIIRLIAFVTFPIFWGIFLVADDAIVLFLTEKWSPIILPLKILCVVSMFRALNAMNAPLVIAKGRPGISVATNLLFALTLPFAFFIGSFYGLEGFSYSWLAVFPALSLITTYVSLRAVELSLFDYFNELKPILLATLFMVLGVILIQKTLLSEFSRPARFSATCLAGMGFYALYYFLFYREMFSEAKAVLVRS